MKFCSNCGQPVALRVPDDDNRERFVCDHCSTIHYQNPRNVVGTIPVWQDKVLLCRRAIEPRHGFWTLPAGFMELGETTEAGAIRETLEEAGAAVTIERLFSILNVVHAQQVHLFYLARMAAPVFAAGPESLEVALFGEHEIPWNQLAFPTITRTLEHFFADRREGMLGIRHNGASHYRIHALTLDRPLAATP